MELRVVSLLSRVLVGAGLLFAQFGAWSPAQAEGRCPPGFYPTGGAEAGWYGCAPMGPMEAEEGPAGNDWDGGGLPPSRFDAGQWNQWMEDIRRGEEAAEAERMKDPRYKELKRGVWEYPGGKEARDVCAAMFLTLRGGILLMDWAGDARGTFLAFFGGTIPPVEAIERKTVSLTQSKETQTVQAFHAPLPWHREVGMIMFAVPSTEALLRSIEDVQDFDVKVAGQTVVWGNWHSGREAQRALRACVARRR